MGEGGEIQKPGQIPSCLGKNQLSDKIQWCTRVHCMRGYKNHNVVSSKWDNSIQAIPSVGIIIMVHSLLHLRGSILGLQSPKLLHFGRDVIGEILCFYCIYYL
jgi:hypothetical protein